ncbi:MAG: carbamoyltransferase [Candidatus Woesearchaeota archaeon]
MYVLGISCWYHDSAAALLKDGQIIAAALEERFTRKKHDNSFPKNAINFCLEHEGLKKEQVDYIVFYEKPLKKFERILDMIVQSFPRSYMQFYTSVPVWINERLKLRRILKKMGFKSKVFFVDHHLSHAGAAFLCSPYKTAAIITIDGVGEYSTTRISLGKENKIIPIKEIQFPHSIGLLYSTITSFLGFEVNEGEFKVMGLAPYGKPTYYEKLKKIIDIKEDGSFKLNMKYFAYTYSEIMFSKEFIKLFGKPRKPGTEITERDKDLAASLQKILEEVLIKISKHAKEITGEENLCMAGGVALNSVANGVLLKEKIFENIFVQPASTDAGSAIGAALYFYNCYLNKQRVYIMRIDYLGPEYNNDQIIKYLQEYNEKINYELLDNKKLLKKTAKLLAENKIIGWFQGRMEFGPRALGNRSILANPNKKEMKDILNERVKHRESFRPFAPTVLEEYANDYFEINNKNKKWPFMLFVFSVRKNKQKIIPAVTHVDGTARIQTVSKEENPLYYDLIKEFYKITKIPVVLNTSFNVRGEPIVMSPKDALETFLKTGIDYLVIGNYFISKK